MTKKTNSKTSHAKRMEDAQKRLDKMLKRIAPFTQNLPIPRICTTEGQWQATDDRMLK